MVDNNITLSTVLEKYFNRNKEYGNDSRYSARELQKILGYVKWQKFEKLIYRTIEPDNLVHEFSYCDITHVGILEPDLSKNKRKGCNFLLTFEQCRALIQNADSRKEKVIEARRYLEKTQLKVNENALIKTNKNIPNDLNYQIHIIRGQAVMIDSDLAILYGVETKVLNQAVKRNLERFPSNFMFQLTGSEMANLRSQSVTSSWGGQRYFSFVFTEQGIAMLSSALTSATAIEVSIHIMNSFVYYRKMTIVNLNLSEKYIQLDQEQLRLKREQLELINRQSAHELKQEKRYVEFYSHHRNNEKKFEQVFTAIANRKVKFDQGVFFDGQIFDAHHFVSDLIRSAEKSIILIDNYVDDSVLHLLTKRKNGISVLIYSKKISKSLQLDLKKYNAQYSPVKMIEYAGFHDRFLILDQMKLYHIGASLKDLGKKVFAFSLLEVGLNEILKKIFRAN